MSSLSPSVFLFQSLPIFDLPLHNSSDSCTAAGMADDDSRSISSGYSYIGSLISLTINTEMRYEGNFDFDLTGLLVWVVGFWFGCQYFRSKAKTLLKHGYELVSGGTENHLVLVNLKNKGIDGSRVEKVLEAFHIAANKNTVPGDISAMVPGGIRMGTPALTSRGFIEEDFAKVAYFFDAAVQLALKVKAATKGTKLKDFIATMQSSPFPSEIEKLKHDVEEYAKQFPTIGFEKSSMKSKN